MAVPRRGMGRVLIPPLPRLRCPVCHGNIALRNGGKLREHPDHRHEFYGVPGAVREGKVPKCLASGVTKRDAWQIAMAAD